MSIFELFITFFKIGLFSFGGGYGMIPLIKGELLSAGVITAQALLDFIAIAESTPGPFAVNIATFIGSNQCGLLGGIVATLGAVLPAFIIILVIVSLLKAFSNNKFVKGFIGGVEPFIIGLIISTGVLIAVKNIWLNFGTFNSAPQIMLTNLIVTLSLFVFTLIYKKITKKNFSAIPLILLSAVVGIIFM